MSSRGQPRAWDRILGRRHDPRGAHTRRHPRRPRRRCRLGALRRAWWWRARARRRLLGRGGRSQIDACANERTRTFRWGPSADNGMTRGQRSSCSCWRLPPSHAAGGPQEPLVSRVRLRGVGPSPGAAASRSGTGEKDHCVDCSETGLTSRTAERSVSAAAGFAWPWLSL